jgi:hypothetical protein
VFELYLSHTSDGEHSTDPRNRFHQTALYEARMATEYRQPLAARPTRTSFMTRLRLAFGGGSTPTTEACNCPA